MTDRATATVPAHPDPAHHPGEVGQRHQLLGGQRRRSPTATWSPNTGNVTFTSLNVTDPMPGLSAINCHGVTTPGAGRLADLHRHVHDHPGRRQRRAGSPTPAPRRDAADGPAVTAIRHAHGAGGSDARHRAWSKSASIANFSAPGVLVTYSYLVTNTGNVSLTVGERDRSDARACRPSPARAPRWPFPANSEICTATYTTTQADVDRGSVTNTGTAVGTPPTGPGGEPPIHGDRCRRPTSPAITFVKSANPTSFAVAGTTDRLQLPGHQHRQRDADGGGRHRPPCRACRRSPARDHSLAPGASETCTATYTTTQADLDRGRIVNTASVTATPPSGSPLARQSSATVLGSPAPSIDSCTRPPSVGDLLGRGHTDHVQLRGHQHRQRDTDLGQCH